MRRKDQKINEIKKIEKINELVIFMNKIKVILFGIGTVRKEVTKCLVSKKGIAIGEALDNVSGVGNDLGDVAGIGKRIGVVFFKLTVAPSWSWPEMDT